LHDRTAVYLGRVPTVKRTQFATEPGFVKRTCLTQEPSLLEQQRLALAHTISVLVNHWRGSVAPHHFTADLCPGVVSQTLLSTMGNILREQTCLHVLFLNEIVKSVESHKMHMIQFVLSRQELQQQQQEGMSNENVDWEVRLRSVLAFLPALCQKFRHTVFELLEKQNLDFQALRARENIEMLTPFEIRRESNSLKYKYESSFSSAFQLKNDLATWMLSAKA
jgi:hypothetical protein